MEDAEPKIGIPDDFPELMDTLMDEKTKYHQRIANLERRLGSEKFETMQRMDDIIEEYREDKGLEREEMKWLLNAFGRPERV